MAVLGIDTSNYATSLAVVSSTGEEVVCTEKQFLPVKHGVLGLRQSDAVFHHTVALPKLLALLCRRGALQKIEAVGVSEKPRPQPGSYMPCFLAGVSFAAAFAQGAGVPLVATSHQQGHVAAALHGTGNQQMFHQKALVFHVSGGTTELLLVQGTQIQCTVGKSLDLYAGQAIDRLGVTLGFAFPAGPDLSRTAEACTQDIRPKISVAGANCHFSGLQNQCEALLQAGKSPQYTAKYCLCAIADTLIAMAKAARQIYTGLPLVCAGGVMASTTVRNKMQSALHDIYFVSPALSADNAVGTALIAAKEAK